jgi:hypothetical protein
VPTVMKSGSLSHLEPSGPVQTCHGIAFNMVAYMKFSCLVKGSAVRCLCQRNVGLDLNPRPSNAKLNSEPRLSLL